MIKSSGARIQPRKDDKNLIDITDAIKGYKVRSEIERAFFFHLFYEILRQQFGMGNSLSAREKDIFERKGNTVEVACQKISTRDIKAVVEGREMYEKAT
jgi:hypothetical protein